MYTRNRPSSQIIDYGLYLYLDYSLEILLKLIFLKNSKNKPCFNLEPISKVQTKEMPQCENSKVHY